MIRHHDQKACRLKKRKMLSVVLLCVLMVIMVGCQSKLKSATNELDATMYEYTRPPQTTALQAGSEAVALAVRHLVYANVATEEFMSLTAEQLPLDELTTRSDELMKTWENAIQVSETASSIIDQVMMEVAYTPLDHTHHDSKMDANQAQAIAFPFSFGFFTVHGNAKMRDYDPQTWAENLSRQFDALKGTKRYQQLAEQMKTDAKTAYKQMALAQEILRNAAALEEAEEDIEAYNDTLTTLQVYKTASKVTLLGISGVMSGGGSVGLLEGAGLVVSGVDCIIDVTDTGSTLILGQDNQVSVAFNDIKDKLGPVSSLIGLVGFNPANLLTKTDETADTLVYISDNLIDFFYEGKVMGFKVFTDKEGGAKLTAQVLEAIGETTLKGALEAAGYVLPNQAKPLLDVMNGWKPDMNVTAARLERLNVLMNRSSTDQQQTKTSVSTPTKYAWVLVETIVSDASKEIAHTNTGDRYRDTASAQPGSYTFTSQYIGNTDTYPDPDVIHGEGYGVKLDITIPPSVIEPGSIITLDFTLAFTEQNISYFDGHGSARADLGNTRFVNQEGKNFFEIYVSTKYSSKNKISVSDTITATAPSNASLGDRIEIWTGGPASKLGTTYIYEWRTQ